MRRRKKNLCILLLLVIAIVFVFVSLRSLVGTEELQHNTASCETQKQTDDSTTYVEFIDSEKNEDSANLSFIAILILCGITVAALLEALTLKHNMKNNN